MKEIMKYGVYNLEEAKEILMITKKETIEEFINKGYLCVSKIENRYLVRGESIVKFLKLMEKKHYEDMTDEELLKVLED